MSMIFNNRRKLLATGTCAALVYVLVLYHLLVDWETEGEEYLYEYTWDQRPPLSEEARPDWGRDLPIHYHKHALLSAREGHNHDNWNHHDNELVKAEPQNAGVVSNKFPAKEKRPLAGQREIRAGNGSYDNALVTVENCTIVEAPHEDFEEPLLWQIVGSLETYVFSAYFDVGGDSKSSSILIIGISAKSVSDLSALYCQVWYRNRASVVVVPATVSPVPEHHDKSFAVFFWYCPARASMDPYAVSLVEGPCQNPDNLLLVRNVDESQGVMRPTSEFTVCLTPVNSKYNDTNRFVEMMEVNRMLGANKVFLYDYSSSPSLRQYFQSYVLDDVMTVIQWQLPDATGTSPMKEGAVHYFGQLAALNDCLYRNMFASRYIVFTDLDEFIVPRKFSNWAEMVEHFQKANKNATAFLFRNVMFPLSFPDDVTIGDDADEKRYHLVTQLKTRREHVVWPPGIRSKVMVEASKLAMIGVHNVWKFKKGLTWDVDVRTAALHHYRHWDLSAKGLYETDRLMHLYKHSLLSRVKKRHKLVLGTDI